MQDRESLVAQSSSTESKKVFPTVLAGLLWLAILILVNVTTARASSLVPQTQLDGNCFPKFAVSLPVFGPAGSIPRVDASSHTKLTVTMKEVDQAVLPQGFFPPCGVKLGKTRIWAYETSDTATGKVLGPANWPAVTLVTRRGVPTTVEYVNQLPSFNASNPTGPGLVQGLLAVDQTLHWADPLKTGCGMTVTDCSQALSKALAADKPLAPLDDKVMYCGRTMSLSTPKRKASSTTSASTSPCCQQYTGPVPATVHLHGAQIPAAYDGGPDSWFTPDGRTGSDYTSIGNPGPGRAIYQYDNSQEPGTLWFHDHALGVTRNNVYAGMAGYYFLTDPDNEPSSLPKGAYEVELAIQDRLFDTNSQLYFPDQAPVDDHPYWSVSFEGDVATVNGAAFPYMNVEPRRYRLHLLNGSNHRDYTFVFGNLRVYQIGADENYFDKPIKVSQVPLGPGERADIIVDFSKSAGQNITVTNTGLYEKYYLPQIMQFRVGVLLRSADGSCDPANPLTSSGCNRKTPLVRLTDGHGNVLPGVKIDKVRQIVINENFDYPTTIDEFVNNTKWDGLHSASIAAEFPSDGVSELPRVGSIELWEIANIYSPGVEVQTHPVHIHLIQFQVLNRQDMNVNAPTGYLNAWNAAFGSGPAPLPSNCTAGQYCPAYGPPLSYNTPNADGAIGGNLAFGPFLLGNPIPPEDGESGWKDTAIAHSRQVLRLLVRWTPTETPVVPNQSYAGRNLYKFDPTKGSYVWHCHLINHEDNEMMRPYRVTN